MLYKFSEDAVDAFAEFKTEAILEFPCRKRGAPMELGDARNPFPLKIVEILLRGSPIGLYNKERQ